MTNRVEVAGYADSKHDLDAPESRPEVAFVALQSGRSANGGMQSLHEILIRLRRVRPLIVTQVESALTEDWRARGFEVRLWPFPWPRRQAPQPPRSGPGRAARDVGPLWAGNARMARLVRERDVRVVHCNDGWAGLGVALGARLGGASVVLNVRDTVLRDTLKWRGLRLLSDRVVVLSREMSQLVERRLHLPSWLRTLSPSPISAIYSVVDPKTMHPATSREHRQSLRHELGMKPGETSLGVVGALMPKKRQLELLEFLCQKPDRLPSAARLYFIGDFDPDQNEYCRRCWSASRGLGDRVRFVGYSSRVADWYRALDLTLMVSRFEGLARSMIESLACGTPQVAFDFCSAREILEEHDCGRVARQGDYAELMRHVERLTTQPELRAQLSNNGSELSRRLFAPERVVAAYEDIYMDLHGDTARSATLAQRAMRGLARTRTSLP